MKKKQARDGEVRKQREIKIRFYIMSMCLMFAICLILTIKFPEKNLSAMTGYEIILFFINNIFAFVFFILLLLSVVLSRRMGYFFKGATNPSYTIKSVKNESYEYLTFLTTYILPLICFDFSNSRYVIVIFALLFCMGTIFVRTNLYYGNPTLALMGFRIYRVQLEKEENSEGILLISKGKISINDNVRWIKIDDDVWYAEVQNDGGQN